MMPSRVRGGEGMGVSGGKALSPLTVLLDNVCGVLPHSLSLADSPVG